MLGPSDAVLGQCPSCHSPGQVGDPCSERICTLRGYCYIPERTTVTMNEDGLIGQRCGDYLLIGVLGSGGFGRVYRAIQLPVGMPAAVKLLDMESGPSGMAAIKTSKFEIEAQALARLSHPNIVRLYQYGAHRGAPFLAMELIDDAHNLWVEVEQRAAEGRPFALDDVHAILQQVLGALEAAHARHIVHRDIKPENIMLQSVQGHGVFAKVLDFGLAKFTEDRKETSLLLGTPAYMAYEQLTRGPLGPWTDLYALGVLAFELLTGKRPYGGAGVQDTLALKLDVHYDPWSRVAGAGYPEELRIFVAHALAREGEARYQDAGQFRVGLERAVSALRAAGGSFLEVPVARLVEATVVPSNPIPAGYVLPPPDPTRRLARPGGEEPGASPDADPSMGFADSYVPPSESDAPDTERAPRPHMPPPAPPRSASTVPAGSVAMRHAPKRSSTRLWVACAVVALAGVAVAYVGTRPPTTPRAGDPALPVEASAAAPVKTTRPESYVRVLAGTYARGSSPHDPEHLSDESLQEVVFERPIIAAATEVTQAQWAALFASRPARHAACGAACPVESVTWWDAVTYANALSAREGREECYSLRGCKGSPGDGAYMCRDARFEGLDCNGWRLPTEAVGSPGTELEFAL